MPRSSSIDSMVEAVWSESIETTMPMTPCNVEKRPSLRPDRPLTLVSPSVGRRMKGQRGINGKSFFITSITCYRKKKLPIGTI